MKLKYVEVVWVDSTVKDGWYYPDEVKKLKPAEITTIGYLCSKGKDTVILVTSVSGEGANLQYANPHLIPARCVREIRNIQNVKKQEDS